MKFLHLPAVLLFTFLIFPLTPRAQSVIINEIMASNATTFADEDGDFEDWIELFNPTSEAINLQGWYISDNYAQIEKWQLPDTLLEPGAFLLIWASGKDRKSYHLHTNFRISSAGEELILSDASGQRVSEVAPVPIPTGISFGLSPGGEWLYFSRPTPGEANISEGFKDLLSAPELSRESGFYQQPFWISAGHPDPEALLRYTLDGSTPGPSSEIFPDSLFIYNRSSEPDDISAIPTTPLTAPEWYRWFPPQERVYKGTNIRIKAFREDALSPHVHTASYWVDPNIHSRYSLPVISLSMETDDILGSNGIYTRYNMKGRDWERQVHISYFEPGGQQAFATDAGIRVHGGNSRRYALKSFRLYFRNAYGESHISHNLFEGNKEVRHDRLILRNAGSDWAFTYFRDAFVQSILKPFSDVETQGYQPAIVFLNGEYWGLMNIRERFDNNYIENYYGYTDIDMLDNTGQVKYGSNAHYNNLINFLHSNNPKEEQNYQWIKEQMNVDNFRDYHILQVFSMNTDQPGKNVRFWRPQTDYGRWRWMWWDMDDTFIFGPHNNYDRNGLVFCTGLDSISDPEVNPRTPPPSWAPNGPTQTFPLRALLENPEFRHSFINRFADLLNTAFLPEHLTGIIDSFDHKIRPYMQEHYYRWHRPEPFQFDNHINHLHTFAQNRRQYMIEHITSFFELEGSYDCSFDIASGEGHIIVNSINLLAETPSVNEPVYPWQGTYFEGVPVFVKAVAAPGFVFSHWEGSIDSDASDITIDPAEGMSLKAHFIAEEEYEEQRELISFWYFSTALPNNEPLEELTPYYTLVQDHNLSFQSSLKGYPFHVEHPYWRKGSMERRNRPSPLNYIPKANNYMPWNPDHMRGLQVKQPFAGDAGENIITFHLPTTGFKDLIFRFAAINEGAANELIAEYSTETDQWTEFAGGTYPLLLNDNYTLYSLDFGDISETSNNKHFKIRLRFVTDNPLTDEDNRVTFNNISFRGNKMDEVTDTGDNKHKRNFAFPNPVTDGRIFFNTGSKISLYSYDGRLIRQSQPSATMYVGDLAAGIYILRTDEGFSQKIILLNTP